MQTFSITKGLQQRVGVFVDVQNMFYSAKLMHQSKLDYGKLLKEVVGEQRLLVRALAYIVQKPEVQQSSFHEALQKFGYELRVKEMKLRPDTNAKEGSTFKGSWQVGLTVDALHLAPKLDVVILISGDGDYVSLVQALRMNGCRVELISFERSTSAELIKAVDQFIPIQEGWMFKEKKFAEQALTSPNVSESVTAYDPDVSPDPDYEEELQPVVVNQPTHRHSKSRS